MGHIQDIVHHTYEDRTILIRSERLRHAISDWARAGIMVPHEFADFLAMLELQLLSSLLIELTREDCRRLTAQGVVFDYVRLGRDDRSVVGVLPNLARFGRGAN